MFKSFKISIVIIAVLIPLIFFHYLNILAPLENKIIKFFQPLQASLYDLGLKTHFLKENFFCRDLQEENKKLKEQLSQLIIEKAKFKILEQENIILKKHLNFLEKNDYQYILAKVIGKDVNNLNTFLLNKGKKDGLLEGLPVIINEGILIGKIIQVKEDSSLVLISTDNRSRLAGIILNNKKSSGIIKGKHGLSMKMEFIPQNEKISVGEIVVTSGLEKNIPFGLIIGQIQKILALEGSLFHEAILNFPDYQSNPDIMAVLIPKK